MSERLDAKNSHICSKMPPQYAIIFDGDDPYLTEVQHTDRYYRRMLSEFPIRACPWCGEELLGQDLELTSYFTPTSSERVSFNVDSELDALVEESFSEDMTSYPTTEPNLEGPIQVPIKKPYDFTSMALGSTKQRLDG